MATETAFTIVPRPKLALWMFLRNLRPADVADDLEASAESVRRYCLPFDSDARQTPTRAVMDRIVTLTHGDVTPGDFYPPRLQGTDDAVIAAGRAS